MNIKQKIATLIVATSTLFSSLYANSVEVMAGNKNARSDISMTGNLSKRVGFLNRNQITVDYNNNVQPFSLVDITYGLGKGVSAVAETQAAPGMGVVQRAGIDYFAEKGNLNAYLLATVSMLKNSDLEIASLINYSKPLNDKSSVVLSSENLANMGKQGFNFGLSNNRIGFKVNDYALGLALDAIIDNNLHPDWNIGGFVSKRF